MQKIKAILFDLDGTLIDSVTDLANSVNYTLWKFWSYEKDEKVLSG